MSGAEQSAIDRTMEENARIGYQTAIGLMGYESGLVWSRFNAMLVANSVIMAVLGLTLTSECVLPVLTVAMSLAGLVLCTVWFLLTKRGSDFYTYWVLSARELEEQYLAKPIATVSRGGRFAEGEEVAFRIAGESVKHRMSGWGRILRLRHASYAVIMTFAILYLLAPFVLPLIADC